MERSQRNRTLFILFTLAIVFCLSDRDVSAQLEGGAISAIDEPIAAGGSSSAASRTKPTKSSAQTAGKARTPKTAAAKPVARAATLKPYNGFIVGDKYTFLNFEVISAAKPYHTREAKAGGASGLVQVEILIDQNGNVLTAKARTGNKLLHPEAERAALESKFNKPAFGGKPARAIGFLVYRFGPAED